MSDMNKRSAGQKAGSAGVAMAVAVVLSWIAGQTGLDVPGEITAAVATIIGWGASQISG